MFFLIGLKINEMKEYTHAEFEEFARIAFYKGREIARYNDKGEAIFKRPTFNGFLREIDALPDSQCGCPKGICVGHVDTDAKKRIIPSVPAEDRSKLQEGHDGKK